MKKYSWILMLLVLFMFFAYCVFCSMRDKHACEKTGGTFLVRKGICAKPPCIKVVDKEIYIDPACDGNVINN